MCKILEGGWTLFHLSPRIFKLLWLHSVIWYFVQPIFGDFLSFIYVSIYAWGDVSKHYYRGSCNSPQKYSNDTLSPVVPAGSTPDSTWVLKHIKNAQSTLTFTLTIISFDLGRHDTCQIPRSRESFVPVSLMWANNFFEICQQKSGKIKSNVISKLRNRNKVKTYIHFGSPKPNSAIFSL